MLVEHPELIAERIGRFAGLVGKERVIAGSDCGFATFAGSKEVHPSIVWAKLKALADGARLASRELWKKAGKAKTVDVDDDLKAVIDKLRQERNTSMKVIVNEALRRGLREFEVNRRPRNASATKPHKAG